MFKVDDLKHHGQARRALRVILEFCVNQNPHAAQIRTLDEFFKSIRAPGAVEEVAEYLLKNFIVSCESVVSRSNNLLTSQKDILLDAIMCSSDWRQCGAVTESLDNFAAWLVRFAEAIKKANTMQAEFVEHEVASDIEMPRVEITKAGYRI